MIVIASFIAFGAVLAIVIAVGIRNRRMGREYMERREEMEELIIEELRRRRRAGWMIHPGKPVPGPGANPFPHIYYNKS